jgi:polysaccharide export outer membrane protein
MTKGIVLFLVLFVAGAALSPAQAEQASAATRAAADPAGSVVLPADYVIGVGDVLAVVFWREQDRSLSTDVVVRPDGKISVPMLNDVRAAGLSPVQLGAAVEQAASKFIREPAATVLVREIHSRRVYVIGEVARPGAVDIGGELTVMQALAASGGFLEHAKKSDVVIVRAGRSGEQRIRFNYKDVVNGKNVEQNIRLLPGDTVLVR